MTVSRFVVTRSSRAGLQIGDGSFLNLSAGEVSHNPIGVNIQATGYDRARLERNVDYHDNIADLDTSTVPLPEPQ